MRCGWDAKVMQILSSADAMSLCIQTVKKSLFSILANRRHQTPPGFSPYAEVSYSTSETPVAGGRPAGFHQKRPSGSPSLGRGRVAPPQQNDIRIIVGIVLPGGVFGGRDG